MRVYKINAGGQASDLRFEDDGYALKIDERSLLGFDQLPEIETLHEQRYLDARAKTVDLERLRAEALLALDDRRLEAASTDPNAPQEVKEYATALGIAI